MIVAGLVVALAGSAVSGTAPACADFLTAQGRKPPHLDFVGCAALSGRQGRPLRATYRVAGRFAAETEAYFIRRVGLHPLKRSCCQWDAPSAAYAVGGHAFTLTMVSPDTPAATRAAWPRIAAFEVVVETLTDDI